MVEKIQEIIGYGKDLGNTFLLTGLIATVIWLQTIMPGIAPTFLVVGAFISLYTSWLQRRNKEAKDCPEELKGLERQ